jgi:hypothetical protein
MLSKQTESGEARSKHHRGRPWNRYVGIDVSLGASSVCVVDGNGKIVCESKVVSEPDALITRLKRHQKKTRAAGSLVRRARQKRTTRLLV